MIRIKSNHRLNLGEIRFAVEMNLIVGKINVGVYADITDYGYIEFLLLIGHFIQSLVTLNSPKFNL